jgi:hypothetical protein
MSEIQSPELKKKSGCGKGCAIGCLTLILLVAGGSFLVYHNFAKILNTLTSEYTATAPATLPTVTVSDQEASELVKRFDAFASAVKEGQPGQALTLTSRDINVLIQKNPKWSDLAGKVYVTLEGDRIHGDASIPLEKMGGPFKGRWLNGSGTFRVETAAGRLLVFMDSLSVRGKPIPDSFMAGVRGKNLAEDAAKNPETTALMQKIDSVSVRDGKLRIVAK